MKTLKFDNKSKTTSVNTALKRRSPVSKALNPYLRAFFTQEFTKKAFQIQLFNNTAVERESMRMTMTGKKLTYMRQV